MQASLVHRARKGLVLAALAASLGLASCQNVNAFVTGEKFYRAPEGSARMEVELFVETQDGFYAHLDDPDARERLEDEISQLVLSLADVGTRFYPILSEDYGSDDTRPAYVMVVTVEGLTIDADHETIEKEGQEPRVESTVRSMDCQASAKVEKRRNDAPPLQVGSGPGKGRIYVAQGGDETADQPSYRVLRQAEEHETLRVLHADVMAAVEEAVVDALRQVIRPVDRDFELAREDAP